METMVLCPYCDARFYVVWANDGFSTPEYCPMCGAEINYEQNLDVRDFV